MRTHDDVMKTLSAERRRKIEARADELETTLRLEEIRKDRKISQAKLAELMNVTQPAISQMEKEQRVSMARLKRFSEALGGRLHVEVEFPDGKSYKVL